MAKSTNTIEINGRRYDARTGKPISTMSSTHTAAARPAPQKQPKPKAPQSPKTPPLATASSRKRKTVDGFAVQSRASSPSEHPHKSRPQATPHTPKTTKKPSATPRPARSHTGTPATKTLARSTTLHRRAVQQPHITPDSIPLEVKSTAKTHSHSDRAKRASAVTKSAAIQKFSVPHTTTSAQTSTAPKSHLESKSHTITLTHHVGQLATTQPSKKEQIIAKALASTAIKPSAKSATPKKPKSSHSSIRRYVTTGLVVALLAGYVTYLNVPSLSMRVAARRAGFAATMPGYTPSGYSLRGPIAVSPGQVSLEYASTSENRSFTLTQQPSTWDSIALKENFVAKKTSSEPMTYQDSGLTIYIFDSTSAAWVNGGKMYTVSGNNSQLNADQLLKIATSV